MPVFRWMPPKQAMRHLVSVKQNAKGRGLTAATGWGIVDVGTWHNGSVAANAEGDAWQGGRARVGVTSLGAGIRRTGNFGVVSADNGGWKIEERGSRVGDGIN